MQPGQGGMPNSVDPAAELGLPALSSTAATAEVKVFSSCNPHSSVRYQYVEMPAMQAMNPSNAPVYMAAPAPANHMEQAVRGMPPNPLQPHSPCAANHPVGTTGFAQPRTVAASHTASICGSAVHHSPCDSICSGGFQPPGHVEQPTSLAFLGFVD